MSHVKYDEHYRNDLAACGDPFTEFAAFCRQLPPGTVLDLGCGQGRDALMFARAGHRVVGVDVSSVGITQMLASARSEGLDVEGVVLDILRYRPESTFDVVVLDRVLHMLGPADRPTMVTSAMDWVAPGGHLLVAEGPKGMQPVRDTVEKRGWSMPKATRNRLIARRPPARTMKVEGERT